TARAAGERGRRAPLPGAGLGREAPDAGLAVVVRLDHGGVRLVRSRRAHAFVLVEDLRRRPERRLEAVRAIKRCRPPQAIYLAHRLRNADPALARYFLLDQRLRKDRQIGR